MRLFGGVFWFVLVIASGMTNFLVKQSVQNLDEQLIHVRRQAADEQRKIHDLTADWTYLNQPELLADLNTAYVHLQAISPKQIVRSVDDIPLRPAPAPPPEAAPQIAEAVPQPAPPVPFTLAPPMPGGAPAATKSPIVPVSATGPAIARPPIVAAAIARPQSPAAPTAAQPASLDALFAQVAGNR